MGDPEKATKQLMGALSICKKAGALKVGFDAVAEAARKGEVQLVLFAADTSAATCKRILAAFRRPPETILLAVAQADIAQITKKPVGVLAVTSKDLAALCRKAAGQSAGKVPDEEETN